MNKVTVQLKIRWTFYAYVKLVELISLLNVEKGTIAYDVMALRVEKYPKLFIKIRNKKTSVLKRS